MAKFFEVKFNPAQITTNIVYVAANGDEYNYRIVDENMKKFPGMFMEYIPGAKFMTREQFVNYIESTPRGTATNITYEKAREAKLLIVCDGCGVGKCHHVFPEICDSVKCADAFVEKAPEPKPEPVAEKAPEVEPEPVVEPTVSNEEMKLLYKLHRFAFTLANDAIFVMAFKNAIEHLLMQPNAIYVWTGNMSKQAVAALLMALNSSDAPVTGLCTYDTESKKLFFNNHMFLIKLLLACNPIAK